jgi:hypothetical protein
MTLKKCRRAGKLGPASERMAQHQQYEIWILNVGDWMLKSSWRDFEVGLAAARALSGPVRIMCAVYDGGAAVERNVVVELGGTGGDH